MPVFRPYLVLAAAACAVAATAISGTQDATEAQPAPVRPRIGEPVAPESLHLVRRPGLYGVSDPAPGMRYAVVGSSLVRIEEATNVVRSIVRGSVRPID